MQPIVQIANLFGVESQRTRESEDFASGQWVLSYCDWAVPDEQALQQNLSRFPTRDKVRLKARVGSASTFALNSAEQGEVKEFLASLETYRGTDAAPYSLELTFEIQKALVDFSVSIYSLTTFEATLKPKNLSQLHNVFGLLCNSDSNRGIELFDSTCSFETVSLKQIPTSEPKSLLRRSELVAKRKDLCHFDGSRLAFLPEDYRLLKRSSSNQLNEVFDRLCLMSILTFISDVSSLTADGKFAFKLIGYRSVSGTIDAEKCSESLVEELFKIYQWIYSDDHSPDKLGLARNLISLHWKEGAPSTTCDPGMFDSILSGFDVYLKKHVDQYIALKNTLTDYLSDFSQESSKLADSVVEKLEKNFLAFAGFFISSILIKSVTDKTFPSFLSVALQKIAWGLVGVSLLHAMITLLLCLKERARFLDDFVLLRGRYADLLSSADLDRILNLDEGGAKITKLLDFKLRLFFFGWMASLVICSILIVTLSHPSMGNPKQSLPVAASTNAFAK